MKSAGRCCRHTVWWSDGRTDWLLRGHAHCRLVYRSFTTHSKLVKETGYWNFSFFFFPKKTSSTLLVTKTISVWRSLQKNFPPSPESWNKSHQLLEREFIPTLIGIYSLRALSWAIFKAFTFSPPSLVGRWYGENKWTVVFLQKIKLRVRFFSLTFLFRSSRFKILKYPC